MHPLPPLRYSLPLGFLALSSALIAIAYGLRTMELTRRNEDLMLQRAAGLGQFVAPELAAGYARGSADSDVAVFGRLDQIPHLQSAFVCDQTFHVLRAMDPTLQGRPVAEAAPPATLLVARAAREGRAQFEFTADRRVLWAVFPVPIAAAGPQPRAAYFCTASDVAGQTAPTLAAQRRGNLIVFTLIAVICAALWWYFDRTITRRIAALTTITRDLAEGRLSSRASVAGRDELAQLGGAINRMAGELQTREAELRQSEASLRAILEAALDCVVAMDHRGAIIEFNKAAERVFGYTRAEAVGQSLADLLIPPDQREVHRDGMTRYLATKEGKMLGRTIQTNAIRKGGTEFPVELTIVRLAGVEPPIFTGFLRDLSERKRADTLRDTLLSLAVQLGAAQTPLEAGRVIFATADRFWTWDAGSLELCTAVDGHTRTLLNIDVIDGKRVETPVTTPHAPPTVRCQRVLRRGGELILLQPPLSPPADAVMFGDTARPSASIMTVPIRWQTRTVGVLSVQSYAVSAFTEQDLAMLQGLADHCGGTLERLWAAEELRLSEERFEKAFRSSPVPMAISTLNDGRFVEINEAFLRAFRYDRREEVVDRTAVELGMWPDARQRELCRAQLESNGRLERFEQEFRTKSGELRHSLSSAERIELAGAPCVLSLMFDITERKRADALALGQRDLFERIATNRPLAESLEAICQFAESLASGWRCSILMLDEGSRRLRHGAAPSLPEAYCRAIDGVKIGANVGSCGTAAFLGRPVIVSDIASDPLWANFRELAAAHGLRACWSTPVLGTSGAVLGTLALYDGRVRMPCPGEVEIIRNATHAAAIALQRARDEEELARAERDRARQLALLETSLNSLNEGVIVAELDGSLVYWNRSALALHGYGSLVECQKRLPEFTATYDFLLPDGKVLPYEQWPLMRVLRGEEVRDWETTLWHKETGWKKLFSYTGALARDPAGRPLLAVLTMIDITARRELEEQFRQSQKMEAVGQLAGGVAHDFNNILTAILMRAELTLQSPDLPPDLGDSLQEIQRLGERAARLTQQLLAFSRRSIMQLEHLDLNEVIGSDAMMLRRLLREDIRLEIRLHSSPLRINADEAMLGQVLLNLAVNARDAMPRGGRLRLVTCSQVLVAHDPARPSDMAPGPCACLVVEDTGSGIAPEHLSHLFEPFFTTKPVGRGTGLGLATVFGIVRQHHGFIKVESQVGVGTSFRIFLPLLESPAEADPVAALPAPTRGTETILLVEDEPTVRRMAKLVLEESGYRVLEAEHGPAALTIWHQDGKRASLLLTDLVMPENMNGQELATALLAESPSLKVAFMTGYSSEFAGPDLRLRSRQNILQKPFSGAELLAFVRRTLDES